MSNFYAQFASAAARFPDHIAVEVQRRDRLDSFTYARLTETIAQIAAWLRDRGVRPGDRCCILAENDGFWCAAYLALLRIGAIAVPLDTAYKATQVATLLRDSDATLIFTSPRHLVTVREACTAADRHDSPIVLLHSQSDGVPSLAHVLGQPPDAALPPPHPAGPSDPAVILYTSGTTSDPKGVVLTHGNLQAERDSVLQVISASERDCILGVLPLFHALAQMANLLLPFSIGARVVFLETVNTTELLRALDERGVTLFACVPQFFYLIHQRVMQEVSRAGAPKRLVFKLLLEVNGLLRRLRLNAGTILFRRVHRVLGGRMRVMVTGGSRFDPAIGTDLFEMGFNILQAYGLTETSGAATLTRPGDRELGSVGRPVPGVEVRVLPPPQSADEAMQDGEVLIRGPVVMAGYFNRPEATVAALRDGWLYTGDLGRLDAHGRLSITGRKKELIVLSSGKNIYPEEIEAHYRQSPVIKELCVLGLARPGEPSAERLYAVVVPDPDILRERRIVNTGEIVRFEMENRSIGLPAHKRVLGYEVWLDPLPRTTTGKLKRFEIERRLKSKQFRREEAPTSSVTDEERQWASSSDVAPVLAVIQAAVRGETQVRPDSNLELDLGLDSMERVELLTTLEHRFRARVPEGVAQRTFTVRELVDAIVAHGGTPGAEPAPDSWADILADAPDRQKTWAAILARKSMLVPILFALLHLLIWPFRLLARIESAGRKRLPQEGPYIISPNHQSFLDVFIVVGLLPYRVFRKLFFVGASDYFEGRFGLWLAKTLNVVPVDPDATLIPAMQASAFGLRRKKVLVLFPEGERSIDGSVRPFKKGAAILAHHLHVPIVPVALEGFFDIWPRNRPINWRVLRPWRRARLFVRFGQPIVAEESMPAGAGRPDALPPQSDAYARTTARLRDEVERMWNEIRAG